MAKAYVDPNREDYVILEDVTLQRDWSRFGGSVNARGYIEHYMHIALEDDVIAQFLTDNGYPVKIWVKKNDPEAAPEKHMKVFLPYNDDPKKAWLTPIIKMFRVDGSGEGVTITKDNVGELDSCVVDHANVTLRKFNGRTPLGQEYVHAQLVYAEFYISGQKVARTDYVPPYANRQDAPVEGGQNPNDDLPF